MANTLQTTMLDPYAPTDLRAYGHGVVEPASKREVDLARLVGELRAYPTGLTFRQLRHLLQCDPFTCRRLVTAALESRLVHRSGAHASTKYRAAVASARGETHGDAHEPHADRASGDNVSAECQHSVANGHCAE